MNSISCKVLSNFKYKIQRYEATTLVVMSSWDPALSYWPDHVNNGGHGNYISHHPPFTGGTAGEPHDYPMFKSDGPGITMG
jgi:hypothetical protein